MIHSTENLIAISDSLLLSLIGFLVVFIALIALIVVIKAISGVTSLRRPDVRVGADQPINVAPAPVSANMVPAKGSAGEINLFDVDDESAALIMAIAADGMKVPLNTLHFKSIRQIEEER